MTHWKIYRGCCLYPAKIHPPRAHRTATADASRQVISNWHIIRRKFAFCRALSAFRCFIRLLRLLFIFSTDMTAAETVGHGCRRFYISTLFLYTCLLVLLVSSIDFCTVDIATTLIFPQFNSYEDFFVLFLRDSSSYSWQDVQ